MKKEYIIYKLSDASKEACKIDNELFPMYNVKRGLRNEDGTGVLVGLTKVGNVVGYERLPEGDPRKTVLPRIRCGRHRTRADQGKTFRLRRSGLPASVRQIARQGRTGRLQGADLRQYAARTEDEDEHPGPGGTEHHEHPGP